MEDPVIAARLFHFISDVRFQKAESSGSCEVLLMLCPPSVSPNANQDNPPKSVEELTARNVKSIVALEREAQDLSSRADRIAGAITGFCGSMAFVWVHVVWFGVWIVWNTILPVAHLDPFPFSFLTLVVSLEAIFLSTFIMISENRQERIDERRSHLDLQINLLSEQENTKMLELLGKIATKLGIDPNDDPSISVLEQATRPEKLVEQIDHSIQEAEETKAGKSECEIRS
jgi:uncharacterized membrane protein